MHEPTGQVHADADGIDEPALAEVIGMTSPRFEDRFKPCQDSADEGVAVVHPYMQTTTEEHQRNLDADDDEDASE